MPDFGHLRKLVRAGVATTLAPVLQPGTPKLLVKRVVAAARGVVERRAMVVAATVARLVGAPAQQRRADYGGHRKACVRAYDKEREKERERERE